MNALCRAYDNIADAERAVEALLHGGVPDEDVRLLMGAEMHDGRREARPGFAGTSAVNTHVGAFAGGGHARGTPPGSFAGDVTSSAEGTFANADRDVVVTRADGREHTRVAAHHTLKQLLLDAGVDEEAAESDIRAVHDGRALVVVTLAALPEDRVAELLDAATA